MKNPEKTRKGDRQILSVSIPIPLYERLDSLMQKNPYNRSALVTMAIETLLDNLDSLDAQAAEMDRQEAETRCE